MTTFIISNFYTLDTAQDHSDPSDPSFRRINFEHEIAIDFVSTQLRKAWTALPPSTGPEDLSDAVSTFIKAKSGSFIRAKSGRSEEEEMTASENPDKHSVHTPWRDAVYYHWNHVFYDVGKFLPQACPDDLCFRPPACETLALDFGNTHGVVKSWVSGVLLVPAFIRPGSSVRISILPGKNHEQIVERSADHVGVQPTPNGADGESIARDTLGKEHPLGEFNIENPYEVWYIKAGTTVRFRIESDSNEDEGGLGAVMVHGRLHKMNDEERVQREIDSSIAMAMHMYHQDRAQKGRAALGA